MTIIGPSWPLDHQDRQDHQVMSTYVRLAVSLFSSLYQHSISSFASDTPVIHIIKRVVFRGGDFSDNVLRYTIYELIWCLGNNNIIIIIL